MKIKLLVATFLILAGITFFSVPVVRASLAGEIGQQLDHAAGSKGAGFDAPKDPRLIVANVISIALQLIGILFLALTVYAGFLWMTAAGNEEQVEKSKKLLFQAVIGMAIVLASYSITVFAVRIALGDVGPNYANYWGVTPLAPQYCNQGSCY